MNALTFFLVGVSDAPEFLLESIVHMDSSKSLLQVSLRFLVMLPRLLCLVLYMHIYIDIDIDIDIKSEIVKLLIQLIIMIRSKRTI